MKSSLYTDGDQTQGPDRVIYTTDGCRFVGIVTHPKIDDKSFDLCEKKKDTGGLISAKVNILINAILEGRRYIHYQQRSMIVNGL